MKTLANIAAVLFIAVSAGCNRHDAEVKMHAEEDYERLHQQLEKERAMDAYRNSPAYKAKVAKQMRERYGNMDKAIKDLRIP